MKRKNRWSVPKKVRKSSRANYINPMPKFAPVVTPDEYKNFFLKMLGLA